MKKKEEAAILEGGWMMAVREIEARKGFCITVHLVGLMTWLTIEPMQMSG